MSIKVGEETRRRGGKKRKGKIGQILMFEPQTWVKSRRGILSFYFTTILSRRKREKEGGGGKRTTILWRDYENSIQWGKHVKGTPMKRTIFLNSFGKEEKEEGKANLYSLLSSNSDVRRMAVHLK